MTHANLTYLRRMAFVIPLAGVMVVAIWVAIEAWKHAGGPPLPAAGYVAMALGTLFTVVVGAGLMALLFYSSRHGYDEPPRLMAPDQRDRS